MTIEEYNICVNQIGPSLLRFVNSNLNNKDVSKDIVQDCFYVLWQNRKTVFIEKAKSYLFSVGHHKLMDTYRAVKNTVDIANINFSVDSEFIEFSTKNLVKYGLSKLKPEYREIITLRDLEGYNYKEIEKITGLSESNVKVNLFRARRELKAVISEVEVTNEN